MNKKIISGLAALAVVFTGAGALPAGTFEGFSLTASAEESEIVNSGECGADLTWTLDSDGTLTISGSGKMWTFMSFDQPPWYAYTQNIKNIIISDGVTNIGKYAFYDCRIKSITIPDSVTSIGEDAFSSCTELTSVTIPDSVTSIGDGAFYNCKSLESITIPDSVKSIGESVFTYCESLNSITISDDNNYYCVMDGVLFNKEKTQLVSCIANKQGSYMIPDSVTNIVAGAFRGCENLTGITIPDSVTRIGSGAFWVCTRLESITIPNGITKIEKYTFWNCKKLADITIPNSVTRIAQSAFAKCQSLVNVTIPDSVTIIDSYAFENCQSLENVTIPDSVTSISHYAFAGCQNLAGVTIPNSVTSIDRGAFGYYNYNYGPYQKMDDFTIKGYKGTAAETYASENGFEFIALDETADKYPVVKSAVQGRQFRLKWTAVPNAEKYGLALYQSGKWRVKAQFAGNVTSYTSPKIKKGTYKMVVCAKVNGEWDTSSINKRAFTVTITE